MENHKQETKPEKKIFRVYYDYGNEKSKYTGHVKVTATSHKEARDLAIKRGVGLNRNVLKWKNVLVLDKDQQN